MSRPRSNELARSGHTALGEHAGADKADTLQQPEDGPAGPVPVGNRPGQRPEHEQDRPVEAFAARFPAPADDPSAG